MGWSRSVCEPCVLQNLYPVHIEPSSPLRLDGGPFLQTYVKGRSGAALLDGHQTRCKKAELNDITHKIAQSAAGQWANCSLQNILLLNALIKRSSV